MRSKTTRRPRSPRAGALVAIIAMTVLAALVAGAATVAQDAPVIRKRVDGPGGPGGGGPSGTEREQERIALAWIDAHNSGDVERMAAFRAEHFKRSTVTEWQGGFRSIREQLGKLEPRQVVVPGPNVVRFRVASETEGDLSLGFHFHADAPTQIAEVRLDAGGDVQGPDGDPGGPDGARGAPTIDLPEGRAARKKMLDRFLAARAEASGFSGTVLIADRDGVWFEEAYGLASREFGVPNTTATRFDVGSFNKDYTRVAILQLAAAGRLSLDDRVGEHLPDYPNERVRREVTVAQLLDHRSGLGDYFTEEYFETPMGSLREIDDYIPIWGPKPLLHDPGTRERYSNFGYTVLGAIVEKITGQDYPGYVAEHVFGPAGMADTGFFETDAIVPNVAVGYTKVGPEGPLDTPVKNIYHEPAKGGPWGKSYSTARDLYRFFEAMFDGRVLEGDGNWLRDGWSADGIRLAGGGPGLNATLALGRGTMVIVLANADPPMASDVAEIVHGSVTR